MLYLFFFDNKENCTGTTKKLMPTMYPLLTDYFPNNKQLELNFSPLIFSRFKLFRQLRMTTTRHCAGTIFGLKVLYSSSIDILRLNSSSTGYDLPWLAASTGSLPIIYFKTTVFIVQPSFEKVWRTQVI